MFTVKQLVIPLTFLAICLCSCRSDDGHDYNYYLEQGKMRFFEAENLTLNSLFSDVDKDELYKNHETYEKKLFENKTKLYNNAADFLIEANKQAPDNQEAHYFLGYAYDRLFGGYTGFSFRQMRSKGKDNNCYLNETRKISAEFEKSIALTRKYKGEQYILGPRSKITSAWSMLAFNYVVNDKPDSIAFAFREGKKRGGYPDELLEFCRNILVSCDTNAILFVNGDNDTFPMWYIQYMEGFRKDVTVINLSLANLPEYIRLYKHSPPFGGRKIPFSFPDDELVDSYMFADGLTYDMVDKGALEIVINVPEGLIARFTDDRELKNSNKIVYHYSGMETGDRQIIRVQDKVIRDILKQTGFGRPVYFSHTVYSENFMGLDDYLRFEGLALRICPVEAVKTKTGRYDNDLMDKCLLTMDNSGTAHNNQYHSFRMRELMDNNGYYSGFGHYVMGIRQIYYNYAEHLIQNMNDAGHALEIVELLNKNISLEKYPPNSNGLFFMAGLYQKNGDKDKSLSYARSSMNKAIKEIDDRFSEKKSFYEPDFNFFYFTLKTGVDAYKIIMAEAKDSKLEDMLKKKHRAISKCITSSDERTEIKEYYQMHLDKLIAFNE